MESKEFNQVKKEHPQIEKEWYLPWWYWKFIEIFYYVRVKDDKMSNKSQVIKKEDKLKELDLLGKEKDWYVPW